MPRIAVSIKAEPRYCVSGMTVQNRPEYSLRLFAHIPVPKYLICNGAIIVFFTEHLINGIDDCMFQ